MEEQYYARTNVWPIMHVIAVKKQILDQYPWVAGSLYNAFLESKNRSLERFFEQSVSRYPIPWITAYARRMRDMFDGDPFPFGIEETVRRSSSSCATCTSRASPTATPRSRTFSRTA